MESTTAEIIRKTKRLKVELAIYAVLFTLSFAFPAFTFYYEEDGSKTISQYIWDFPFLWLFVVVFVIVFLGILSQSRIIIHLVNIVCILLTALFAFAILMMFAWWGVSPYHPDYEIGYYLIFIWIGVLIIRSYSLLSHRENYHFSRALSKWSGITAIAIPVLFISFIIYSVNASQNAPIMRSGGETKNDKGQIVINESWDYLEAYHAFADKYYSIRKLPNGKTERYLDSVQFTFFNDQSEIGKRFTRKSINGELDIEEILDDEEL